MWKYLKKAQTTRESKESLESCHCLPEENGLLSRSVPASAIAAANLSVSKCLEQASQPAKRGKYQRYSDTERAEIGRRAAEIGITATIKYYEDLNPKRSLPLSSVYTWKVQYTDEVAKLKQEGKQPVVKDLPCKKGGRSLLLGEKLDSYVEQYLKMLRDKGGMVNTALTMACAEGFVTNHDSNLLTTNGGYITTTKDWAKSLLQRMGFVERRASTSARITPDVFDEQFLFNAKCFVGMGKISDS